MFIVESLAVMVIHCCIWFKQKVSCEGLSREGISILKHLYLNDYTKFDSKISYIMFLHDCLLACEISTVKTLALSNMVLKSVKNNSICLTSKQCWMFL